MRMRAPLSAAMAILPASPGLAEMSDLEVMQLSAALGQVLASEEFCGLTYDQAAITAFIAENVSPDRLDFAGNLQMMTMAAGIEQQNMSESAKTAHCAAIGQTARHYSFTE